MKWPIASGRGRGRRHPPRVLAKSRERMVLKNGECNISRRRVLGSQRMRLVQDLFTSMVDLPWRWILLILGISFFGSWLFFGENNWTPCLTEVYNFTSCFLFSMENQHTTGFGGRAPTEECPEAIFLMCAQAIVGVTLQTAMLGIVFAKIIRPKQRTRTILFSDNAVVCLRDGALCLMFRLADMRKY
ncbi:Inwardly rectifying K+ channel, putative [Gryllus bimaculatus]|nr:Inwardly rectifying K+ channel, putative [Gryllus bimaculatus]